jgi:hypothetical protein
MTIKNIIFLVLITLTWTACDKSVNTEVKIQYSGDKITLNGVLETDSVSFKLSKSLNPWKTYQGIEYYVKNGKIWIEDENKNTIINLTSKDNYTFSKVGKLLKVGAKYKVYASADGLKQVETDWLTISSEIKPTFLQEKGLGQGKPDGNKINILVNDAQNKSDYYSIGRYGIYQGRQIPIEFFTLGPSKENCYNTRIFDDACFNGKQKTLEYGFLKEIYNGSGIIKFDTIQIFFGTVNKDAYDLWNSFGYNGTDPLIEGLNEPPPSYSNVKNGYGVVFTRNWSSYIIPVKK